MNKILLIHPYDNTTLFLSRIIKYLETKVCAHIEIIEILPTQEHHSEVFRKLSDLPSGTTVAFLGHGSSDSIMSACDTDFKSYPFINVDNISSLRDVKLFCFSCRSADFLKKGFSRSSLISSIGFDDIPTDWPEVLSARKFYSEAFEGFEEGTIEYFNNELVEIVSRSLEDYIINNLTFSDLYNFVILRINQAINRQMQLKDKLYSLAIIKQLYHLKKELILFER